jgi:hypothetical protein
MKIHKMISINVDVYNHARAFAVRERRNFSNLVEVALEEYMKQHEPSQ